MPTVYEMGQEVLIKTVSEQGLSVREAAIRPYAGHTGQVFYLYTVRVGTSDKEIVLYEDEIEPVYKRKSRPVE